MFKKKKEYDYFHYFEKTAAFAVEAAEYLNESLNNFAPETFHARVANMHVIENRADNEKHDMIARLIHEFLPPIDSEDIVALAHRLDDVVDSLDDIMLHLDMFCVKEIRLEAIAFSELILSCCRELEKTVKDFRNFKNSGNKIARGIMSVTDVESEGDKLHSRCVKALYSDDSLDPRTVFAGCEI